MTPHTPALHNSYLSRAVALTEHLSPAWFAMVMGWAGLSLAWFRASEVLGETAKGLGLVGAVFSLLIFSILCIACLIRLSAHPHAVAADMRHPVKHALMATLPISMMLLATLGVQLFWNTSPALNTLLTWVWCVGSVLEIAATVWVIGRWLNSAEQGGFQWGSFTPVFFIPVVGNALAPLGGVPIGLEGWASAQLGVGLLLWPVLQTLLFVRMAQAGPLPARLSPSLFITLVPPSIIGLDLLTLHAPLPAVWMMWGVGTFFLALSLTQLDVIRQQAFGLGHWAMSFPMAAITTLTFRLAHEPGGAWLQLPSMLLLAVTSLLILGLTLGTWRGLRHGQLLVPEP